MKRLGMAWPPTTTQLNSLSKFPITTSQTLVTLLIALDEIPRTTFAGCNTQEVAVPFTVNIVTPVQQELLILTSLTINYEASRFGMLQFCFVLRYYLLNLQTNNVKNHSDRKCLVLYYPISFRGCHSICDCTFVQHEPRILCWFH